MKKIHLTILALIAGVTFAGLSSCKFSCVRGSGNQKSEERKVGNFKAISISGGFKVILKQDSSFSVKITADDNLIKYIKTETNGTLLKVYTRKNMCNTGDMIVNIGFRDLEELKASGAVEVASDGRITVHDLRLRLSGATKITMDLNAAELTTKGSGVTELNLKGQASSHNIELSGSGKVHALDFVVNTCNIETSGIGNSEVNVLNTLNVHSSGASSVKYRGNPTIRNDKSGVSSIEKVN